MKSSLGLALAAAAGLARAHFKLEYPLWRNDTLTNTDQSHFSQRTYPCAGAPGGTTNRTDWPLGGGSVRLQLHDAWAFIFVNIGLGDNVTNFNVSITPEFFNATGTGNLCIDQLNIPSFANVTDGALGAVQVVTVGPSGAALYNCADVRFLSNTSRLSTDDCRTDNGIQIFPVQQELPNGTIAGQWKDNNNNNNGNGNGNHNGAAGLAVSSAAVLIGMVGATGLFAMGMDF